jgi:hypothetical protein
MVFCIPQIQWLEVTQVYILCSNLMNAKWESTPNFCPIAIAIAIFGFGG